MFQTLRRSIGGWGFVCLFVLSTTAVCRGQASSKDPPKSGKDEVHRLIKLLHDKDDFARLKAAKQLGEMGAEAKEALPDLNKLLTDPDIDVRSVASNAVDKIQRALEKTKSDADNKKTMAEVHKRLEAALDDKKDVLKNLEQLQKVSRKELEQLGQQIGELNRKLISERNESEALQAKLNAERRESEALRAKLKSKK